MLTPDEGRAAWAMLADQGFDTINVRYRASWGTTAYVNLKVEGCKLTGNVLSAIQAPFGGTVYLLWCDIEDMCGVDLDPPKRPALRLARVRAKARWGSVEVHHGKS